MLLDRAMRLAIEDSISVMAEVALPPIPSFRTPYEFFVSKPRMSPRVEPGRREVAFSAEQGELLTALRFVSSEEVLYVEVVSSDGAQHGYSTPSLVGGLAAIMSQTYREARIRFNTAEKEVVAIVRGPRREADQCWARVESLRGRATSREEEIQADLEFFASTPSLLIDHFRPSRPNSAGGVDLHVGWRYLNPDKTVKYIRFTARPYNAVGDVRRGTIGGHSEFTGYSTGPLEAERARLDYVWGNAWYNYDISCVRLTRVWVEYTDGTSHTYARELPSILAEGVSNTCTMESQRLPSRGK